MTTNHEVEILLTFDVFLIFYNFLRSSVLSHLVTFEATHIFQFITADHVSFHLCWKENLLNHEKVSKYYEHDCSLMIKETRGPPERAFFWNPIVSLKQNLAV